MPRSHLRIEEKELDFEFKVVTVQFNERGRYVLTLTVENPLLEDSSSGVQLRVNDGEVLHTSRGSTEPIQQENLDAIYTCLRSKFVFTLPKGFCKNDKNHDVRLRVEAVRLTDSKASSAPAEVEGARAGEAFFAIFPRTDAPRINPYASQDEELYRYCGIMALLRVHDDYLAMHCGRLAYAVAFHESRPSLTPAYDIRSSARVNYMSEWQTPRPPSLGPSSNEVPQMILGSPQLPDLPPSDPAQPRDHKPAPVTPHPSPRYASQSHLKPEIEPDVKMDAATEDSPPSTRNEDSLSSKEGPPILTHDPEKVHRPLHEAIDTLDHRLLPPTLVTETPPGRDEDPCSPLSGDWQVSYPGKGAITVILHGASNLPPLSDGGVPHPFVVVKCCTIKREALGPRSLGITHCSLHATHCPAWGEKITVEQQDGLAQGEVLILSVADSQSQELLVSFQIRVEHLVPFHHYNLELLQEHSSVPEGVRLYVSLVRRISMLPRLPHFSFTGFEVLLQAVERPFRETPAPLVAVARIVPDYELYRGGCMQTPRAAGIAMTSVTFPHPSDFAFAVSPLSGHGHLQVSPTGAPVEQPVWNHCFLFLGWDCATIFTGQAALVIEYYPTPTVMNSVSWYTCSPLGFSALILDQQLYGKLMSETGLKGLRVEHLSLQGSMLKTTSDTSVGIILRLIGSERPDSLLTEVDPSTLPCLDLKPLEEAGAPCIPDCPPVLPLLMEECDTLKTATPVTDRRSELQLSFQRKGPGLPPYDALAQILPEYQHLFRPPKTRTQHTQQPKLRPLGGPTESERYPSREGHALNETYRLSAPATRRPPPETEDDSNTPEVAEHQTRELDNYRTAMRKMADDIITLRKQVGELESENSRLRTDLSLHQDVGRTLLDDTDIDVMTKAEIADCIVSLKFKLASETSTTATQRDKIQQLQNELIKKNDGTKELIRLQRAHQQQQAALQRCQNRLARTGALETTVSQQDKVIEKMEKVLDSKLRGTNKENAEKSKQRKKGNGEEDNRRREIDSVLATDNSHLRAELERTRLLPPPIIIQQPVQKQVIFPDSERLSLLSQLERANTRIFTLESQLNANSRCWGKEMQDMLTRLNEQDHGFTSTSSMTLPLKSSSLSAVGPPGRHRALNPLK